ncbi:MAG: ABC transporter ATP-binding protein [Clostridia bacterium]|nr:ABC transporter ATP-binding protein [Clostridia bacterium]
MMKHIIEIENLNKSFGEIHAVDGISFNVNEGELFAFLGQNGAGKSTTISIICGRLLKDAGSVKVNNYDLDKDVDSIKRDIGVVFQNSALDAQLTVIDNLKSRAALYGIFGSELEKRIKELTELLDLGELLKRPLSKLSGGQKRRIDIARALIHKPKILILDEPTTGLDPQTRKTVWNVIKKLQTESNMTVFLTTHYMEEAAGADNVVILDSGRIAAEGTPHDLKNRFSCDFITLYDVSEEEVKTLGMPFEEVKGAYRITVKNTSAATDLIVKHKDVFRDYEITKGGMDDVFLAVTGKKLSGGDEK